MKDQIFRLEEMLDSMRASIENIKGVKKQQEELIEIVENSDKKEDFKDFIDESKKQIDSLGVQILELSDRVSVWEEIINECYTNDSSKELINKFVYAIKMFRDE